MGERPVVVFDGACGFCRRWIARWRRITGDRVEYVAWQDAAHRFPEVSPGRFAEAVHLRDPDGRWTRGAAAALGALRGAGVFSLGIRAYERVPGFARAAEALYRWVAANRSRW